ncbi:MAG: polysaccharide lyase family 8 super-sandwich domain-containing protein [Opitutales bacterium]
MFTYSLWMPLARLQTVASILTATCIILMGGLRLVGASSENGEEAEPARSLTLLLERYNERQMEGSRNEAQVRGWVSSIREDGSWSGINYEDVSRTGFQHQSHLARLLVIARAYSHPESEMHGDSELKNVLFAGLGFWFENDFISDNWWHNQIGVPRYLADTLLLLDGELSDEQRAQGVRIIGRANLEASGARPGGDLVQIAEIMVKGGILARDARVVMDARQGMIDEIRITTGRGIQPDHSFHHRHDGVIQTTSYGRGFTGAVARYALQAEGTVFSLPKERLELLIDHKLDGIRWTLAHGRYRSPGSMNREVTRRSAVGAVGPEVPRNLIEASSYREEELSNLIQVRLGEEEPAWSGNRFFWRSEHMVHQGDGFHASVRMYSSRNHSTEGTYNEEGLKNHHLADGSLFLTRTGSEYRDIFPVWDWQKIPGTTVVQKPALPASSEVQKRGLTEFVGGVSDGAYGAAAFDFKSPHDPLEAQKAWFFFDNKFVALGAGIRSESAHPVATTLNQSRLVEHVVAGRGDRAVVLGSGVHELRGVDWVHHDGVVYLFFSPADVNLENEAVTGNWRRANHQSWATEEVVQEEVFKLWLDHGVGPEAGSYAYVVVPQGFSEAGLHKGTAGLEILANTPDLQAVKHRELGLSQIVFYSPGEIELAEEVILSADKPCVVMVRLTGDEVESVVVADPARNLDAVELTITARLTGERDAWDEAAGTSRLFIELPGGEYAGRSVVVR